jgi:hypothetical protein
LRHMISYFSMVNREPLEKKIRSADFFPHLELSVLVNGAIT